MAVLEINDFKQGGFIALEIFFIKVSSYLPKSDYRFGYRSAVNSKSYSVYLQRRTAFEFIGPFFKSVLVSSL